MNSKDSLDTCLASQQIRDLILQKKIISPLDETRIQPSSYEPIIDSELFILDTETNGLFRPSSQQTVYKTLLELPNRQRQKINIADGFELKKGFTYLIPLENRLKIIPNLNQIKSSPKSSFGRLFLNTRLLADFNNCFDEVNYHNLPDLNNQEIALWLFVQPLAFNVIVHPGLSLNQLRFLKGYGSQLSPSELVKELKNNPILYLNEKDNTLVPAKQIITDGLEIHLNLSGTYTQGIIGLRARHNPTPIDLAKKNKYVAEDFFEPIKGKKNLTIKKDEYFLLSSAEILNIPAHLNVELRGHSNVGFHGPLHFAGFIDNGFKGDLVFEVRSDELSSIELEDNMPVSKLDVCRTYIPDKLYGKSIGSNYQKQVGARPSKHFKAFDFSYAARNYEKLDRQVLVQDANILRSHRTKERGFEFLPADNIMKLYQDINTGFFQSRYDCEDDDLILQPIPYVLLFGSDKQIFSYVRAENIKDYGTVRLFGKHSIGLGGHISIEDAPNYVQECLKREVTKEEVDITGDISKPKLVGTLMAYDKPVDEVHFGLIFSIHTNGEVTPKESSIISGKMIPYKNLAKDNFSFQKYETWSRILIPHLAEIQKLL